MRHADGNRQQHTVSTQTGLGHHYPQPVRHTDRNHYSGRSVGSNG